MFHAHQGHIDHADMPFRKRKTRKTFGRLRNAFAPFHYSSYAGGSGSSRQWTLSEEKKSSRWIWPLSLMATTVAGAAVVVLRGCWHRKMSWPVRSQESSYQVCLNCGIKRLFDEKNFRSYGPYSYDLERLISWERARRLRQREHEDAIAARPAS